MSGDNIFIKLPEIQIDTELLLTQLLLLDESEWKLLQWSQYVFFDWRNFPEVIALRRRFKELRPNIECMRFNSETGLDKHCDGRRTVVIQVPLSDNCRITPTVFYDSNGNVIDKLEWSDSSAWMFNTHAMHSVHNTSDQPRYMLCMSFYGPTYASVVELYKAGKLFKRK